MKKCVVQNLISTFSESENSIYRIKETHCHNLRNTFTRIRETHFRVKEILFLMVGFKLSLSSIAGRTRLQAVKLRIWKIGKRGIFAVVEKSSHYLGNPPRKFPHVLQAFLLQTCFIFQPIIFQTPPFKVSLYPSHFSSKRMLGICST